VAALDRALALEEVDELAVAVSEHLHLDVPDPFEVRLDEHTLVAEGALRLALGRRDRLVEVLAIPDDPHPLPAAACRGLHEHRETQLGDVESLEERHAGRARDALRLELVAHGRDRLRGRTDPEQPRFRDGPRETWVLGEEAVAGVDGVRSGSPGDVDERGDVQICSRARAVQEDGPVRVENVWCIALLSGVDGDRRDAHVARRPLHAHGDLTAIGNEELADRHESRALSIRLSATVR
jgi:hypothetical protein